MMFVFSWKSRLWFLEKDRGLAWFSPVNQYTGTYGVIDLGQFLKRGGGWAFATNWTYDSGDGMDDGLVFVGNNGDMIVYEGTDPASAANFRLVGVWFIGRQPIGRRNFCQWGGDVLILTEFGVMAVADFVAGRITNPGNQSSVAQRMNPYIARAVSENTTGEYWSMIPYLKEEQLIVTTPARFPYNSQRYNMAMGMFRTSWSFFTGMDMLCGYVFQGSFYWGSRDGKLYLGFNGYKDKASYDGSVVGSEVIGQVQCRFADYGTPSSNKRLQRVRILGRSDGTPAVNVKVVPEYDLGSSPTTNAPLPQGTDLWDIGLWNQAIWNGGQATLNKWIGVRGFGKRLSLALAVRGLGSTLLSDYEVTYEEGGGF
jgi:hypothetical protein